MDIDSSSSTSSMSTSSSLAPGDRILSVKSSITSIEFNERYTQRLEQFVNILSITTKHAYCFSKYMFLRAFEEDLNFDITQYINRDFFSEVWLSLIDYPRGRVGQATAARRVFIQLYLQDYLQISRYTRQSLAFSQQSALIGGGHMYTAYSNNIQMHFGNHFRRAVNVLLDVQARKQEIIREGQRRRRSKEHVSQEIRNLITLPAARFKITVANFGLGFQQLTQMFPERIYRIALESLRPIFDAYSQGYQFIQNNVYYDSKSRPIEHMCAFYELARLFVRLEIRPFNCFPLRRSWIPSYVTIDTKILYQNILGRTWRSGLNKEDVWRMAVNLRASPFRPQEDGVLRFRGTIQTDGVGVTILKKRHDRQARYTRRYRVQHELIRYVTEVDRQELRVDYRQRCVTVDPGRRDLYFVHERSRRDHPIKFRHTLSRQNQFEKRKKYRRITEEEKTREVLEAERSLENYNTLNVEIFIEYLRNMSLASLILQEHYATTMTVGDARKPLHRKLKLSVYIKRQLGNDELIRDLVAQFGDDAVFIMGNWSAPNVRFHEPTRGIGFRRLLARHGLNVLLIDEFRTSRCCPGCHGITLETFKSVPNPRPYRRRTQQRVIRHGLLRCANRLCAENMRLRRGGFTTTRLWNRDLAACLNMLDIVHSLRNNNGIPLRFQRNQ